MTKNNECKMNAEAYGSQCRLDTSVKPEYDKRGEYGRSMTEMLGTLAIIGVLSIGGIAGYSYGMDKYRANETINDINLRGIDLIRQMAMGQTLSLSEWSKKSKAGYDIGDPSLIEGDAYISVSSVPKRVCEMVYEAIQNNKTIDIEINEATNGDASDCNKDENNTIGFFFNQNSKISDNTETTTTEKELCCNWSDWINNSTPTDDFDSGDIETYEGICLKEHVQEIECRMATDPFLSWEILGQNAQCNKDVGFVCNNEDQFGNELFGLCYDYEIRVLCCLPKEGDECPDNSDNSQEKETTTTTTPKPSETTTTTLPPPPTEPSPNPSCSVIASTKSSENPGCPAAHCDDTGLKVIFYAQWDSCWALECNWDANYEDWWCME